MANVNQEIDTIRVGDVDYEISDPHALYGEHDESAPDLTDNPLYESDLVTQVTNDSTKPSAANVPYQLKQEINQLSSDLASKDISSKVTVSSGISVIDKYAFRSANTVQLIIALRGKFSTNQLLLTLDADIRPKRPFATPLYNNNSGAQLTADSIWLYETDGIKFVGTDITEPTDVRFSATYIV